MCNTLSPPQPADEQAQRANDKRSRQVDVHHISVARLLITHLVHNVIVVAAYIRTKLSMTIIWAGVEFTVVDGRVMHMRRRDDLGNWYTVPRDVTMEESLRATAHHAAARLNESLS